MSRVKPAIDGGTVRSLDRITILLAGQLWIEGRVVDVKVRNISLGGVMLEMQSPPKLGTSVVLETAKTGSVEGVVAWQRHGRCGLAFDKPVSIDFSPKLAKRQTVLSPDSAAYKRPGLRVSASATAARPSDWRGD